MILYYLSIAYGSAGRASVFNNSFPLFVALIAILVLKERVVPSTIVGLIVAFSGVAVVLWDGAGIYPLADTVGMLS
ncbi:MAG: EamA/RhaT family transporter, partial [Treponema sp.]